MINRFFPTIDGFENKNIMEGKTGATCRKVCVGMKNFSLSFLFIGE